ncbi:MAG TPA: UvrD-helicase domain-containing protein [Gemmatimonadaceae bacterium]|nr:UvrD-helicase domain-containing protein [Gemmatimonadaceae bacterium]
MAVSGVAPDPLLTAVPLEIPSPSQRAAIEAPPGPTLVLAGPGAGKTFCLIERIRYLIEQLEIDPTRICAFTFTNKAADEIASRLARRIGSRAEGVKRRTLHAFCAELLREHGSHVNLGAGFGIADEEYQRTVLRRLIGGKQPHRKILTRFSVHRLRGDQLYADDARLFAKYEEFLAKRNVVDFDTLVVKAAELLEKTGASQEIRNRWRVILVDEFQDLNPVQYRIIYALARDHRHVFAVGDDEQSIYAWAGADPRAFTSFINDFALTSPIYLAENRRCPRHIFDLARRLIENNPPIFDGRAIPQTDRISPYEVTAFHFDSDERELTWVVDDIVRDRAENAHNLGEIAVLYRKHEIGNELEAALLNAGIPCRLAHGRALSEEPVIAYVLAALRVIAHPRDEIVRESFFATTLPTPLLNEVRTRARARKREFAKELVETSKRLAKGDANGKRIRLALSRYRNLLALERAHGSLEALVADLLSQNIRPRSPLEERHDELSDPADHPEIVRLAERFRFARERDRYIDLPRLGGIEIALGAMLAQIGVTARVATGTTTDGDAITPADTPSLGLVLGTFKAAQVLEIGTASDAFRDFTAVDIETTDRDLATSEVVEIAAVRVRDGEIVEVFNSLVKPDIPIAPGAVDTHGIRAVDVSMAPRFADIWPKFAAFCGEDIIVAHNGYSFDFPILDRMVRGLGKRFELCTYDTLPLARDLFRTSRKLSELARVLGIDTGTSHRALDDARTLARVFLELGTMKVQRARKTALANLLDLVGLGLALCDKASLCGEALLFRDFCVPYVLGRYSSCLEMYERECGTDESLPGVDEVIEALGGTKLMVKIRTEKTAHERYPSTMLRLRRLIEHVEDGPLNAQIQTFLERVTLSARGDGVDVDRERVNLLTLHSTKGLEFSRVYVVGVEDAQMPGRPPSGEESPKSEVEEARRLLYVGMTRAKDRLVLSRAAVRRGNQTGGHRFLDEMGLIPVRG